MPSEYEKMIAGKLYCPAVDELSAMRHEAHRLNQRFNALDESAEERDNITKKILNQPDTDAFFQGPISFDYGVNTTVGKQFYANFNFTVLDCCPVTIGDSVMIGPNVSLLTPLHPLRPQERNVRKAADGTLYNYEYGAPITIGDNCWIAGDVTVLGGVTIGSGSVIGAGSVVTKDIPDNVIAVGNPCRVLREITDDDQLDISDEFGN